jgi:hypothetical protein
MYRRCQSLPVEAAGRRCRRSCHGWPCRVLARDLPETVLHVASRRPTTQPSTAPLTCAIVWAHEVVRGVVNLPRIDGKDGVAGSTPVTDVFRLSWEHGVNGQAQVIKGMQQIIHSYTLLGNKEAMSGAVANVRWLIAAGIRDLQAMLDELGKLQMDLPRDARAPDEPNHDD